MKLLILGGMLACQCTSVLPQAVGQENKLSLMATGPLGSIALQADSIQRQSSYPSVIQLKGNVEIKTKTVVQDSPLRLMIMVVRADEADYHEDTSEIEARGTVRVDYRDDPSQTNAVGNVRIKLEPVR
jgi:lipopolysaccharide assembly outer membrane protein LptD (OstA)